MNLKPLHDRVVIKPLMAEEKTVGGIIIPDTAKETPSKGEVIAVGEGARNQNGDLIPMSVKVGDTVLYAQWNHNEMKLDGQKVLIMRENDIMGIVQ